MMYVGHLSSELVIKLIFILRTTMLISPSCICLASYAQDIINPCSVYIAKNWIVGGQ